MLEHCILLMNLAYSQVTQAIPRWSSNGKNFCIVQVHRILSSNPSGTSVNTERLRGIPFTVKLRWQIFRFLERFATPAKALTLPASSAPRPALWVFASTIGEVNAISPLLRELISHHTDLQLVLLTDRNIYRESYLAQFPLAEVVEIGASASPALALARLRPPQLFVVAEIPCLPADAPCRLPFGYLYIARQSGARLALVNGWLYRYAPSCRLDDIERRLLGSSYLRLFDVLCVQTEAVAEHLREAGAPNDRLHVTGNIKFDAMQSAPRFWQETPSPQTLNSIEQSLRPVIVAGCVTDDDERDLVLDAFEILLQTHPDSLLVLAPRHPENPDVMNSLRINLQNRHLTYRCRSEAGDQDVPAKLSILVLDSMGELRDFYARAHVAHVGKDHNLLEPLAFSKPVTVMPGWNPTYPSHPVYSIIIFEQLAFETVSGEMLAAHWSARLRVPDVAEPNFSSPLNRLSGATHRSLDCLFRHCGR